MAYAIVKVGGKQYRVEKGDELVVDRLREDQGAKVALEPLLFRPDKGDAVIGGDDLGKVKVEATSRATSAARRSTCSSSSPSGATSAAPATARS